MRLTELAPRWLSSAWQNDSRFPEPARFGVSFLCPHCRDQRLAVLFKPYIDPANTLGQMLWAMPDAPNPNTGARREVLFWQREGETFETLTLSPSIDVSAHGHWHGTITNGEVSA